MDSPLSTGLLVIGVIGIVGVSISLGFLNQNKDNGAEINKSLGIIGGVTAIIIIMFGIASYIYFSAHINHMAPFVLIMTFVNLFLSVFAVSSSSLQAINS